MPADSSDSRDSGRRTLRGFVNHFALLKHDADRLLALAGSQREFDRTVHARSAILLYVVALEALINRVIDDFWPTGGGIPSKNEAKRWPTVKKWMEVPQLICGAGLAAESGSARCLKVLFRARNDFVHAKPDTYELVLDYWKADGADCDWYVKPSPDHPKYEELDLYRDPSEWTVEDATRVKEMIDGLVEELRVLLAGRLSDAWLWQDTLVDETGRRFSVERRWSQ